MNYQQTIDYLFESLPLFSRIGAAALKPSIDNTLAFCHHLGDPHLQFRSIHVGGTNGKGSVSHMLASVLDEGGYKTGLYTSPHLFDFRERIRISNEMVSEEFVVDFVSKHKGFMEDLKPSFFETTVAMAFQAFAEAAVDVAVIEVGLGGRLDSTNVITPLLSIITQIGMDHTALLGDRLELIAVEKAGIIKPGVPVVIGERQEETEEVFLSKASSLDASIFFAEDSRTVTSFETHEDYSAITVMDDRSQLEYHYQLDLPGIYQKHNILTVLQAIELLKDFDLTEPVVHKGLKRAASKTGLKGRWQHIANEPRTVLEVAHNPDGMREMLKQLQLETYHNLHVVIGMVKDKDVDAVLSLLPPTATYYFTQSHIPRALPAAELKAMASLMMLRGEVYENADLALAAARRAADKDDLVLVCGSIFLVAEVNTELLSASPGHKTS